MVDRLNYIACCVCVGGYHLSAHEGHSLDAFVEVDVGVVGEDCVEEVEGDWDVCAVDCECFHEVEESVLEEVGYLLYLAFVRFSNQN